VRGVVTVIRYTAACASKRQVSGIAIADRSTSVKHAAAAATAREIACSADAELRALATVVGRWPM